MIGWVLAYTLGFVLTGCGCVFLAERRGIDTSSEGTGAAAAVLVSVLWPLLVPPLLLVVLPFDALLKVAARHGRRLREREVRRLESARRDEEARLAEMSDAEREVERMLAGDA